MKKNIKMFFYIYASTHWDLDLSPFDLFFKKSINACYRYCRRNIITNKNTYGHVHVCLENMIA